MNKIFYVIEVNKGKGATGVYFTNASVYVKHDGHEVSTDIEEAIKIYDKASAEKLMSALDMTLKDWRIEEHMYCE